MSFENYEANGYKHGFGFANHLALYHACFLSYGKWLHREKISNNTRLPYDNLSKELPSLLNSLVKYVSRKKCPIYCTIQLNYLKNRQNCEYTDIGDMDW